MYNWYLESGKESDVVSSTRVRIARNLVDIPFYTRMQEADGKKLLEIMKENVNKIGYNLKFLKLEDIDDLTKMELVEKHLISPDFVMKKDKEKAILINDEENICIMVNEEDHLRIQVFGAGLDVENVNNLAMEIDEKIGNILHYAYSEQYGFLTSCPSNVGTGQRISIMVHLPALSITGNVRKILEVVDHFGMNIRGLYGEGSKIQASLYQISNKQTLGISEKEMVKNIKIITEKVIEQERLARKILEKNHIQLEDKVYRAFGIISNCRKISSEEALKLLSDVKLGTDLGIIKELTDLKVAKMNLYTKPANLQKMSDKKLDLEERDIKRAEIIKQIINEK